MKKCNSCDMLISGNPILCPLCQSRLTGTASSSHWPKPKRIKQFSLLYNLQLFLVLSTIILLFLHDFVFHAPDTLPVLLSIPVTVWLSVFELLLKFACHWVSIPAKLLNISGFLLALLLLFTAWYLNFMRLCVMQLLPIENLLLLFFNFIAALRDKDDNVLAYLLCTILVGCIPYFAILFLRGRGYPTPAWNVCLITSLIILIAILVFQGRQVLSEVHKRMHI